jgi:hypothetical protein
MPARANSLPDSISKKPTTKKGLVEWLKVVGPEFKPQYHKIKKSIKDCGLKSSS